jgi:predicted polyphosphate/ATP-dependent NAD kinase
MKKLGLIVNPVAGMGGAVGLKGTDGPDIVERAARLGAVPRAGQRAEQTLSILRPLSDRVTILTYGGAMGEAAASASGFDPVVIGSGSTPRTTPQDTVRAARRMAQEEVDLLLFAGGDGTARDVFDAVNTTVSALGIPAGVKIHSAVFASSPAIKREKRAEVMDIDEDAYRRAILSASLYGYLRIPDARRLLQGGKAATAPDERSVQAAIAASLAEQLANDFRYLVGPGTTCAAFMELLGLDNTLLGIDLIHDGHLIGQDMSEREILEQTDDVACGLVLTPVGGQGFLLGRGNQQLSPAVIQRVGKQNIIVAATAEKLSSLHGGPLLVDTGDSGTDSYLCGYYRVVTGYRQTAVYRVSDCT